MFKFISSLFLLTLFGLAVRAQDPYIGEIRVWPLNFAPRGWNFCDGTLLSINQNQALFALMGTTYGGNGQTNFALPDLRGVFPLGASGQAGQTLGARFTPSGGPIAVSGVASGLLSAENIPAHTHDATFAGTASTSSFDTTINVARAAGQSSAQAGGSLSQGATSGTGAANIFLPPGSAGGNRVALQGGSGTVTSTPQGTVQVQASSPGASQQPVSLGVTASVNVPLPPFLALNYIIALEGIFPSRN